MGGKTQEWKVVFMWKVDPSRHHGLVSLPELLISVFLSELAWFYVMFLVLKELYDMYYMTFLPLKASWAPGSLGKI